MSDVPVDPCSEQQDAVDAQLVIVAQLQAALAVAMQNMAAALTLLQERQMILQQCRNMQVYSYDTPTSDQIIEMAAMQTELSIESVNVIKQLSVNIEVAQTTELNCSGLSGVHRQSRLSHIIAECRRAGVVITNAISPLSRLREMWRGNR